MICPHCDSQEKSSVLDTRKSGDDILRRRECASCGGTFVTLETVDEFTWPGGTKSAQDRKAPEADPAERWTNGALQEVWR
jgi:transcriptional regulator NrdR family protein